MSSGLKADSEPELGACLTIISTALSDCDVVCIYIRIIPSLYRHKKHFA